MLRKLFIKDHHHGGRQTNVTNLFAPRHPTSQALDTQKPDGSVDFEYCTLYWMSEAMDQKTTSSFNIKINFNPLLILLKKTISKFTFHR